MVLNFTHKVNMMVDIVLYYHSLNKLSRKLLSCVYAVCFGEKRCLCVVMFCALKEGKTYRLASALKYRFCVLWSSRASSFSFGPFFVESNG